MIHKTYPVVCFIVWSALMSIKSLEAADTAKPVISSVTTSSLTTTEATITWTTNEASSSQVQYGLTARYDSKTRQDRAKVTSHTVRLTNLAPATLYHYRVKSKDASKNMASSQDFTFSTLSGVQDVPPPPPPPPPPPAKAFPGAVGFGTETPGGRGGTIWKVTNLNDSGVGSLRAAAQATGKRIVVFEVSGTIHLLSEIKVRSPYLTIAGQTAPSPGITLRGAELNVNTHDVLIQHIRVRVGDQLPAGMDPESLDGISADGPGSYNVVFDHVSVSWALDENASSWGDNVNNVTFSNCIISEALYDSLHPKGHHSMGLLSAANSRNVSVIGNLMASNSDRNPLITNGTSVVIANNVLYNWIGGRATGIGNAPSAYPPVYPTLVSIVGNVFIGGPNTTPSSYAVSTTANLNTGSKIYLSGNSREKLYAEFRNLMPFDPKSLNCSGLGSRVHSRTGIHRGGYRFVEGRRTSARSRHRRRTNRQRCAPAHGLHHQFSVPSGRLARSATQLPAAYSSSRSKRG